uniref:Uncharacterized protein n=1 Tax=Chlamydomonas euryale TaxID=1486919 RepID=A0A7R9Z1Q5_9CHLO
MLMLHSENSFCRTAMGCACREEHQSCTECVHASHPVCVGFDTPSCGMQSSTMRRYVMSNSQRRLISLLSVGIRRGSCSRPICLEQSTSELASDYLEEPSDDSWKRPSTDRLLEDVGTADAMLRLPMEAEISPPIPIPSATCLRTVAARDEWAQLHRARVVYKLRIESEAKRAQRSGAPKQQR